MLEALDRMDLLSKLEERADPSFQARRRSDTACKRLRMAFAREIDPLVRAAASVAHKVPMGPIGRGIFAETGGVLARVPRSGIRQRDRNGVRWMDELNAALLSDIVIRLSMPALTGLYEADDGLSLDKASVRTDGLGASFDIHLDSGDARLSLTARFDLRTGELETTALLRMPGSGDLTLDWDAAREAMTMAPEKCGGPIAA